MAFSVSTIRTGVGNLTAKGALQADGHDVVVFCFHTIEEAAHAGDGLRSAIIAAADIRLVEPISASEPHLASLSLSQGLRQDRKLIFNSGRIVQRPSRSCGTAAPRRVAK
jgi:hypothetical protein